MNALQKLLHPENTAKAVNIAGTVAGSVAGAAAAPAIAGAAGATTIPVLTAAGNLIGLTIVSATPVGWIVGTAVVAGAVGYGVARIAGGVGGDVRECRIDGIRRSLPKPPSENEVEMMVHHAHPYLAESERILLGEQLRSGDVGIGEVEAALRECQKIAAG